LLLVGVTVDKALLDELRRTADPLADAAIGAHLSAGGHPASVFRALVDGRAPESDPLRAFVAQASALPTWAKPARMARGADFFCQFGLEIGLALFCSALPIGYAARPVAEVLDLTARLETDTRRRVFETAQFVLDVTTPGGLRQGAAGHSAALHVRLMHAGIRHLVANDKRVRHNCSDVDVPHWCDDWGVPLSQEHLLGALLAFGYAMLRALDTFGIRYDEGQADDYLHLWSVVAHLMGLREDLLPLGRDEAAIAYEELERRDVEATAAGQRLTAALVSLLEECGPDPLLRGLPVATMRMLLGPELSEVLALPAAGWHGYLLEGMRPAFSLLGAAGMHNRAVRLLLRRLTRGIMVGFVLTERRGGRPSYRIPDHLAVDFLPRRFYASNG
jgi:hypothetical protein